MKEGDKSMSITAVGGDIAYLGKNDFLLRRPDGELEARKINRVGMIAAGSGIAPMYQLT